MESPTDEKVPPVQGKRSIAYELGRMDSLISNGSNDSSINSMEIDDQFVGMNLDKNSNETENNNEVSVLTCECSQVLALFAPLIQTRNRFGSPGSGSLVRFGCTFKKRDKTTFALHGFLCIASHPVCCLTIIPSVLIHDSSRSQ